MLNVELACSRYKCEVSKVSDKFHSMPRSCPPTYPVKTKNKGTPVLGTPYILQFPFGGPIYYTRSPLPYLPKFLRTQTSTQAGGKRGKHDVAGLTLTYRGNNALLWVMLCSGVLLQKTVYVGCPEVVLNQNAQKIYIPWLSVRNENS